MSKKRNRAAISKNQAHTQTTDVLIQEGPANTSHEPAIENAEVIEQVENTDNNDAPALTEDPEINDIISEESPAEIIVADNTENSEIIVEPVSGTAAEGERVPDDPKVKQKKSGKKKNTEVEIPDNITMTEKTDVEIPVLKQKKSGKKKNENTEKPASNERVKLIGTSYHYYRNFLKELLRTNEISSAKFVKDNEGWKGYISILSNHKKEALTTLADYRANNPDVKDLWW